MTERRALPTERVLLDQVAVILHLAVGRIASARQILTTLPVSPVSHALGGMVDLAAGNLEGAIAHVAVGQQDPSMAPRIRTLQSLILAAATLRQGDAGGALAAAEQMAVQMDIHGVRAHLALVPRPDLVAVRDLLEAERPRLAAILGDIADVPDVIGPGADVEPLSERERLVVAELVTGDSQAVIAKRLGVSVNTVKSQLRSSYRKLGVSSREKAVTAAIGLGLLTGGSTT